MIRLGTAVWLTLVAILGFSMFKVKYEVMQIEDQLARVNRAIGVDQDSIHVLKAEWSFLSQPSRLAELSRRYLDLAPLATQQLGQIDSVPLRAAANPVAVAGAPAAAAINSAATTAEAPATPAPQPRPSAGGATKLANAMRNAQ